MKTALIIVDVQRDFCPGGALAVEGGDQVVGPANRLIDLFEERGRPVFFTRDWHPGNHCSFKENGGPWPPHCIAGTAGAEFHPDLHVSGEAAIISKADRPEKDAYSGFEGTDLRERLTGLGVDTVVVAGLTTDYCVKKTALDAHRFGFKVVVAVDAVRAVNLDADDGPRAVKLMQIRGVEFAYTDELIQRSEH
jgi:nicotinamidase/pyrazinamidase